MDVDTVNTLDLNSINDSTIINVNLYSRRAQITRVFKFEVIAGQNKIVISGLPNVLDHESLRVEGKGPATIHGVASSKLEMQEDPYTSPLLNELSQREEKATNALARCKKSMQSIDEYMGKLSVEHLDILKLGDAIDVYDITQQKWDDKILRLVQEIKDIQGEKEAELERLGDRGINKKLRTQAVIGLFAERAAKIEIVLIYAVSEASWEAGYDIRVNMQEPGVPVKVVYKAAISQKTGERWENVPITLETVTPTFGLELPSLPVWTLSHTRPAGGSGLKRAGSRRYRKCTPDEDDLDFDMSSESMEVTSKGNVNATFRVPGKTTIPSDDEQHNVTIAELDLEATMSWVCIPKSDTRVHLKATITNSSEYTFLDGTSNVYVDQSFISRSNVPNVSPKEVFECPLGLDTSIRVTYHPLSRMVSQSGFYTKSTTYAFSQTITVHNSKSVGIERLKIIDHIAVSQDANITVNLTSPSLTIPLPSTTASNKATLSSVTVVDSVVAQWSGNGSDANMLGKNGQLEWMCSVPALAKINLLLQWEASTTQKTAINGL